MAENSNIEWTHHTFNPWRGCTKVSAGCANCYAETLSKRNPATLGEWGPRGKRVMAAKSYWKQPLKWNAEAEKAGERRRVFCASLADVFEDRPELWEPRNRLFDLIEDTPNLDWLLLTKRPENVNRFTPCYWRPGNWPTNVWLGTSVENQQAADERIPHLLNVPATMRFLSCEPLLSEVNLRDFNPPYRYRSLVSGLLYPDPCASGDYELIPGIDWVIAGGESGPNARPMHPDWARSLRDQCQAAGVPFFYKQWGEWFPYGEQDADGHMNTRTRGENPGVWHAWPDGNFSCRIGKKQAGRFLDGRTWDEYPEVNP